MSTPDTTLPKALTDLIRGTDDADLVVRLRRKDPEAVGLLYDRYGKIAYSLAFRILGVAVAAETAVFEAVLKCWNRTPSFHETRGGALGTWLLLTTCACAIAGREGKEHEWLTEAGPLEQGVVFRGWSKELDGDHVQALFSALCGLDAREKQVLELAVFGALNPDELPATVGCSRPELDQIVAHALAKLAAAD